VLCTGAVFPAPSAALPAHVRATAEGLSLDVGRSTGRNYLGKSSQILRMAGREPTVAPFYEGVKLPHSLLRFSGGSLDDYAIGLWGSRR